MINCCIALKKQTDIITGNLQAYNYTTNIKGIHKMKDYKIFHQINHYTCNITGKLPSHEVTIFILNMGISKLNYTYWDVKIYK